MKSISILLLHVACFALIAAPLVQAQQEVAPSTLPQQQQSVPSTGQDAQNSTMNSLGMQRYVLGPGDVLELTVFNKPQFNGPLEVDSEGYIEIPLLENPIVASCRNVQEVSKDIAKALQRFLRNPQVKLRVAERRSRPTAVVSGAVRMPQQFQMFRRHRLLQLLAFTGGVTEQASGTVQVFHTEPVMCPEPGETIPTPQTTTIDDALQVPFTVYKLDDIKLGKEEANPFIRPGDIVVVQEASPVYITGAVISPQPIYLRNKLKLTRAIAMVGGMRKDAKENAVRIYRQKPGGNEQEVLTVNFGAIKKMKAQDVELQPYDVIEVVEAGPLSPKMLGNTLINMATGGITSLGSTLPIRVLY